LVCQSIHGFNYSFYFRLGNFSDAWKQFIQDPHVGHASYSMTILDSQTGSILFEHDKDVGLPPASSHKTITAAAALHYLGPDYTYETILQYSGEIDTTTGFLDGYVYIVGENKLIVFFRIISQMIHNRKWRSITG
jgi:D-alanyl-D-alanine carboxypeptidase